MRKKGTLYIVATPIGNLSDLTARAASVLGEVSVVVAEDTRVARKLLSHLAIQKPLERADDRISPTRAARLAERVAAGESMALVSDAGTPNISDPGWQVISAVVRLGGAVVPIPGPSAITAAISIAHFPVGPFSFHGFPPHKKGREAFFDAVAAEEQVVVLYESTHRIVKTVLSLAERMPAREMLVAKELTKVYERVWRGSTEVVAEEIQALEKEEQKGEWVIVCAPVRYANQTP